MECTGEQFMSDTNMYCLCWGRDARLSLWRCYVKEVGPWEGGKGHAICQHKSVCPEAPPNTAILGTFSECMLPWDFCLGTALGSQTQQSVLFCMPWILDGARQSPRMDGTSKCQNAGTHTLHRQGHSLAKTLTWVSGKSSVGWHGQHPSDPGPFIPASLPWLVYLPEPGIPPGRGWLLEIFRGAPRCDPPLLSQNRDRYLFTV